MTRAASMASHAAGSSLVSQRSDSIAAIVCVRSTASRAGSYPTVGTSAARSETAGGGDGIEGFGLVLVPPRLLVQFGRGVEQPGLVVAQRRAARFGARARPRVLGGATVEPEHRRLLQLPGEPAQLGRSPAVLVGRRIMGQRGTSSPALGVARRRKGKLASQRGVSMITWCGRAVVSSTKPGSTTSNPCRT